MPDLISLFVFHVLLLTKQIHWETALRCLGYRVATDTYGLILGTGGDPSITCYSDSDWVSNPLTRRNIGGHLIHFGKSVITWSSRTQRGILALSTTDSAYVEMALLFETYFLFSQCFRKDGRDMNSCLMGRKECGGALNYELVLLAFFYFTFILE